MLLLFFNIPFKISMNYDAIEIEMDDPTYCLGRTIAVSGYYHFNLFSESKFTGNIWITGYECWTDGREMMPIPIVGEVSLLYEVAASEPPDQLYLGRLYREFGFRNMMIGYVLEEDGKAKDTSSCRVIVANAVSREEAFSIAQKNFWPEEVS